MVKLPVDYTIDFILISLKIFNTDN